jgi:hypothetical protein
MLLQFPVVAFCLIRALEEDRDHGLLDNLIL